MSIESHHWFVFRADAGPGIGSGHVMRCLALANRFKDSGHYCSFACRQETIESVPALAKPRMSIQNLNGPDIDEPDQMKGYWGNKHIKPILVVDHYDRGKDFEQRCRSWVDKILVLEDLPERQHDCDLLLDASPAASKEDYDGLVPNECKLLTGPKYALIRQEFLVARKRSLRFRRDRNDRLRKIFVSFGSMDGRRLLLPTLKALRGKQVEVDVAVGGAAAHLEKIRQMIDTQVGKAKLHIDSDSVAELMASAGIGIGAGGITALERCVVGLPSLICCTADNQRRNVEALDEIGAALMVAADEDFENVLGNKLKYLQDNPLERSQMAFRAASVCDGLGTLRVLLECIGGMSTQYDQEIEFRPAIASDAKLIYSWQTCKNMRTYFRDPGIPTWDEHQKWYENKLLQPQSILLLVTAGDVPVGLLRLDPFEDKSSLKEVSILIAPEYQNKKMARTALSLLETVFPDYNFAAEVLPNNVASHKLFSNAGYNKKTETWYVRSPAL